VNHSRRSFLKSTGIGFLALGLPPSFLVRAAGAEQGGRGKALVVIFQRGGMDGLNVVIPFKDQAYYALRPSIAVKEPAAGEERAIDLDGYFALHPALASLKTIYDNGKLAIVHAAGSPDNSRSHSTRRITWRSARRESRARRMVGSIATSAKNRPVSRRFAASRLARRHRACWPAPRRHCPCLPLKNFACARRNGAHVRKALCQFNRSAVSAGGKSLFDAMARLRAIESKIPPSTASYPAGRSAWGSSKLPG